MCRHAWHQNGDPARNQISDKWVNHLIIPMSASLATRGFVIPRTLRMRQVQTPPADLAQRGSDDFSIVIVKMWSATRQYGILLARGSRVGAWVVVTIFVTLFFSGTQAADSPPSVDELLALIGNSSSRDALDRGKIIWEGRKSQEADSNALAGAAMAIFPASIDEILAVWESDSDSDSATTTFFPIDDSSAEALEASFSDVRLSSKDKTDIKLLLNPRGTKKFNYSQAEIRTLEEFSRSYRSGNTGYETDAEAASAALRSLLMERHRRYKAVGTEGLEPYLRGKNKQVVPAEKMDRALSTNKALIEYLPEFIDALRNFPEAGAEKYDHAFGWVEVTESGRPLFLLNHTMSDVQDDYALFFLRQYYLTNTLDFLAVLTVMLTDGDSTFVGVLTQTATDKVGGRARPVAAPIGRTIMAYNLRPLFEAMREKLEAQGSLR
jgi:hypothetical protein